MHKPWVVATAVAVLLVHATAFATDTQTVAAKAAVEKPAKLPAGYKRKIVKGQEMFCTRTTVLGSRFQKDFCVDEAGLQALQDLQQSNQQDLRRAQSICAGGEACQFE
jgi:hypothetical protein